MRSLLTLRKIFGILLVTLFFFSCESDDKDYINSIYGGIQGDWFMIVSSHEYEGSSYTVRKNMEFLEEGTVFIREHSIRKIPGEPEKVTLLSEFEYKYQIAQEDHYFFIWPLKYKVNELTDKTMGVYITDISGDVVKEYESWTR